MPIDTPTGNMVVDIGGGTSEAAVIAMNGIVTSDSVRIAGMKLDEAIMSYIRRRYNLVVGEATAEEIKVNIGSATPLEEPLEIEVKGRDQVAGLPEAYREPLVLRALQGMRSQEISQILEIPPATVDTRVARARRMLRERLEQAEDELMEAV